MERPALLRAAAERLTSSLRFVVVAGSPARAAEIRAKFPALAAMLACVSVAEPSHGVQVGLGAVLS